MIYHDLSRSWEENLSHDNSPNRFWAQAQGFQIPPNHHESLRPHLMIFLIFDGPGCSSWVPEVTIGSLEFSPNDPAQHMLLPAKLPKDHQKTAGITLPGPVDGGPNLTTQTFQMEVACVILATYEKFINQMHKTPAWLVTFLLKSVEHLSLPGSWTCLHWVSLEMAYQNIPWIFAYVFLKDTWKTTKNIGFFTVQTHLRVNMIVF